MRKAAALSLLISPLAFVSLAQEIPLENWTVPPYAATSSGGIQVMTDISGPRAFVPVRPCRVADTRGNAAPIQGGIFTNSQSRDWTVTGICGIPGGADAISVNFTIVSAPATPQGGFFLAWPTGSPPANPVAIMTYGPGVTVLSNAAIVPLSGAGSLTVNVSHSTHIIMDVNGYFSDRLGNPANGFELVNNSSVATIRTTNLSTTCDSLGAFGCGIDAVTQSGTAIYGSATRFDASVSHRVHGSSNSTSLLGAGVRGDGVLRGVHGFGLNNNTNAAGVFGNMGLFPITVVSNYNAYGVRGEGSSGGVLGISPYMGTSGSLINGAGVEFVWGALGMAAGIATDPGCPSSPCNGPWAVMAGGASAPPA